MPFLNSTEDSADLRLSWVATAVIAFSVILTLAGQPTSYWQHPGEAIRGDGLSVFSPTNPTWSFWISYGWQPFVLSSLLLLVIVNRIIILLPRPIALMSGW